MERLEVQHSNSLGRKVWAGAAAAGLLFSGMAYSTAKAAQAAEVQAQSNVPMSPNPDCLDLSTGQTVCVQTTTTGSTGEISWTITGCPDNTANGGWQVPETYGEIEPDGSPLGKNYGTVYVSTPTGGSATAQVEVPAGLYSGDIDTCDPNTGATQSKRWYLHVGGFAPTCDQVLPHSVVGMATTADGKGYWIAAETGQVSDCGDAQPYGQGLPGTAAIAGTPDGKGFWTVTGDGRVSAFGDAHNYGGLSTPLNKPIVAMAADPATGGYWLLGGDGGVFSFNAPFYGSTGNIRLNQPAVGLEATNDGGGYRFVASDGGIFDFGDARFYGSTGNIRLNKPVVGMANDPITGGYWLDASDGGIFSFNAPFYGSTGNITLAQPCVGMTAMPDGKGYRFVARDGGIFDFGDAPFEGSGV